MQTRAVHELKTWPAYFAAIRSGDKPFEIRRNDRDFAVGDTVVLAEFDPEREAYTGQTESRSIRFLLSEEALGVIHGFVVIGFGPLPQLLDVASGDDLTPAALADWHATQASNASLRAQEARKVSDAYANPKNGAKAVLVAADRHAGVADLAEAESRFHAAAAAIVSRGVQS